jgi:hypothetical protein
VTYRTLESLKPDPQNARTHSRRQVDQIAASIRGFGFTNPILRDVNGVVIAGHGRLLAAKAIGLTEVPTIELVGLTEAQKRALRLADNKIALNAGWDLDLLKVEIAELSALDLDVNLTVTGFSTGELDIRSAGRIRTTRWFRPARPILTASPVTSGFLATTGSATAGTSRFCGKWSASSPSTPPSSISLQRPHQRPRERARTAPGVRHGVRRDDD